MSKFIKKNLIIIVLIFLAASLRLWKISTLPELLHRDETSIAFNAYSLLKTGKDEHGVAWPISFKAFGDYKLPGLIYVTILSIKLFGFTEWAVRLPTAFFSILTLPAFYWLILKLGWSKRVALIATFLLTFSFWHISQSRNIYEPIAGLFFSITAWAAWLAAAKKPYYYLLTLISYSLGSFFYNVPLLLAPLLVVSSYLIAKNWPKKKNWAPTFTLILILVIMMTISWLIKETNASRFNTTIFSHPDIIQNSQLSVHAGLVSGLPSTGARLLNHSLILGANQFLKGYASAFDPSYLFFLGDHNSWHNLRSINLGNMNPALLITFLSGLYFLVKKNQKKSSQLTLAYLFLSPVISALTIDAPITNRLLDFHLALTIVSALGINTLWKDFSQNWSMKKIRSAIFPIWMISFFIFELYFLSQYFFLYNPLLDRAWYPGLKAAIIKTNQLSNDYDQLYISRNLELGYSYFAFYTPFNPHDFQKNALWQKNGFEFVAQYQKYRFENFPAWAEINSKNVNSIFNTNSSRILILETGQKNDAPKTIVWEKQNWHGQMLWYAWETNLDQAIAEINKFPIIDDRAITLKYLQSCQQKKCDQSILEPIN